MIEFCLGDIMKKSIIVVSIVLFVLLLSGCSLTPESAVKTHLEHIKTGADISILEHLIKNEVLKKMITGEDAAQDEVTTKFVDLSDTIVAKIRDFDYEITGKNKNEDGTVDVFVNITTYDLKKVFKESIGEVLKDSFSDLLDMIFSKDEVERDTFLNKMIVVFGEKLAVAEKTYRESVSVKVEKNGLKWELAKGDDNKDLYNAISGGIINDIEPILNMLK
jgi:hypothetical protein